MVRGDYVRKFIKASVLVTGLCTPTSGINKIKFSVSEALTKITATNRRQYFPKVKARCEGHISQYKFILLRLALLAVCNAQRESYDKAKISSQDL
jgi:hypothetical protein